MESCAASESEEDHFMSGQSGSLGPSLLGSTYLAVQVSGRRLSATWCDAVVQSRRDYSWRRIACVDVPGGWEESVLVRAAEHYGRMPRTALCTILILLCTWHSAADLTWRGHDHGCRVHGMWWSVQQSVTGYHRRRPWQNAGVQSPPPWNSLQLPRSSCLVLSKHGRQ